MRIIFLALAAFALAACRAEPGESIAADEGQIVGLDRSQAGKALPDIIIVDPSGAQINLADVAPGEPLLVNLWASWCAPCVKELPTLLSLSQRGDIKVLALSQDIGPHSSVAAFLAHNKVAALGAWQDPDMAITDALRIQIMPTTILYDSDGKEVWRFVGENEWDGADAAKLIAEAA